jgi:triosephosphate isomerase
MNMLPNEAIDYIQKFQDLVKDTEHEVILCVPYTDLFYCLMNAQDTNIHIGAQNMHFEEKGAFTGEVSPAMLKSINCEYVIIGHSERRQYYNETDETVNKKLKAAFEYGIKPIVCVGESLEQREAGKAEEVITTQTRLALDGLSNDQVKATIIAYEPIWAIGTGKTATSEDANDAIKAIRNEIRRIYGDEVAEEVIIQYGGSVKSSNAKELFTTSDIDGGLVGGASLKPDEFSLIVNYDKE